MLIYRGNAPLGYVDGAPRSQDSVCFLCKNPLLVIISGMPKWPANDVQGGLKCGALPKQMHFENVWNLVLNILKTDRHIPTTSNFQRPASSPSAFKKLDLCINPQAAAGGADCWGGEVEGPTTQNLWEPMSIKHSVYIYMYVYIYVCMYVCMYVLKNSQQLSPVECSVEHAQLCCFSRCCLWELLSWATWAKRCQTFGCWCTGMLVYCTHTWILTRPLDMLTIVVCMSSQIKCWTLTVANE